jgi:DNA-binding GntR family transcriptional regulator
MTVLEDIAASGNVRDIYDRLRTSILSGALAPGAIVSQLELARELRVSRTPLREALRLLQAQGFLEARHQYRMRVSTIEPQAVDGLYGTRILTESMALTLTVPMLDRAEIDELHALAERMQNEPGRPADAHRAFHLLLVSGVDATLHETIRINMDHADRIRFAYIEASPHTERRAMEDHRAIAEAVAERNVERAVYFLSRHIARTALGLLNAIAPDVEPRAIRTALRMTASREEPATLSRRAR